MNHLTFDSVGGTLTVSLLHKSHLLPEINILLFDSLTSKVCVLSEILLQVVELLIHSFNFAEMSSQPSSPKPPKKKNNVIAKLFHRKSKRKSAAEVVAEPEEPSPECSDAINTNANNHLSREVDSPDHHHANNMENDLLEQAMLESYAMSQPALPTPSQNRRSTNSFTRSE
jgi:hypothetical protein